ncbi:MAG: ATP-binding protein [Bryobacteraceae bacterium]
MDPTTERGAGGGEQAVLNSNLESVDAAEAIVVRHARALGFEEDDVHKLGIAVRECMVNAVVHGNRYNARKKVHLLVTPGPDRITITITDQGNGFELHAVPDPLAEENILRHSGRGILLVQAFMDEFEIRKKEPSGTQVKLVKYLRHGNP